MAGEIFADFPTSHVDKIKAAVRDTLRGDETLNGWSGGRIHLSVYSRVRKIRDALPVVLPCLLVSGISEDWTPSVGSEQSVPVPIGITMIWEQSEDVDVEDFGVSHSSAIAWIQLVLSQNYHLQIPRNQGPRLVTRRTGFEVTSLEYEEDEEYDVEGLKGIRSTVVHVDMIARYETDIDYDTWQLRA
jgi:hypothetical protein